MLYWQSGGGTLLSANLPVKGTIRMMKKATIGPQPKTATIFPEIYAAKATWTAFVIWYKRPGMDPTNAMVRTRGAQSLRKLDRKRPPTPESPRTHVGPPDRSLPQERVKFEAEITIRRLGQLAKAGSLLLTDCSDSVSTESNARND
jgi:hypothetical protein